MVPPACLDDGLIWLKENDEGSIFLLRLGQYVLAFIWGRKISAMDAVYKSLQPTVDNALYLICTDCKLVHCTLLQSKI